jgi:ubiquitin carboxyl-terminal hydrolase 7
MVLGKIFRSQDCPGHVGLMNQGATCYLNSLIQTLFHVPVFKNFILKSESTAKIATGLRKLFASLILSEDCAISTKDITTAFGWSNAEVFDQHDIQELFCSMTDALSQESSEMDAFLTENFKGSLIGTSTFSSSAHPLPDSLECPSCGFKKVSNVSFQDVPLNLSDNTNGVFLTDLLQNFSAVEVLDENNLWACGKCSQKVAARKSSQIESLPTTLFLHLKRLSYDQVIATHLFRSSHLS